MFPELPGLSSSSKVFWIVRGTVPSVTKRRTPGPCPRRPTLFQLLAEIPVPSSVVRAAQMARPPTSKPTITWFQST